MSDQPPLNPDALRVATTAAHDAVDWKMYDVTKFDLEDSVDVATIAAVSAYLAVAQPVVNSVEELDQLPAGSAITTFAHGRCTIVVMKVADNQWASTGQRSVWTTKDVHAGLMGQTATVLHHPEVNDA